MQHSHRSWSLMVSLRWFDLSYAAPSAAKREHERSSEEQPFQGYPRWSMSKPMQAPRMQAVDNILCNARSERERQVQVLQDSLQDLRTTDDKGPQYSWPCLLILSVPFACIWHRTTFVALQTATIVKDGGYSAQQLLAK